MTAEPSERQCADRTLVSLLSLAAVLLCSQLTFSRHLRATGELVASDPGRVSPSQGPPGSDRGNYVMTVDVFVMIRMLMMVYGTFYQLTSQDKEERHLQLVELNVIEQGLNVFKTGGLCKQVCWV